MDGRWLFWDCAWRALPECHNGPMDPRTPSESDYTTTTNPERFEAVIECAHTIMDRLETRLVVERSGGNWREDFPRFVGWADHRPPPLRLIPSSGATMVFGFTPAPGVAVRFGRTVEVLFPACLCDACNAQVSDVCEDLRFHVEATTTGGFREAVKWRKHEWSFESEGRIRRGKRMIQRQERKALGGKATLKYEPWPQR